MEFWITVAGLLRRKWVVIPAVLVALALGALAYVSTPKTYVSSTTMVLTTTEYGGSESRDPTSPTALTNPMLNFSDSLRTTSAILIQAMSTKDVAAELGVRRTTKLVVDDGRSNPELLGLNGPFLFVLVQSTSPAEAQRIVVEAQKLMRQKLKQWQDSLGAPKTTFVSLVDVVPASAPEANHAQATKLGLMATICGLLLSLGIAYFGHQFRRRRRARAAARATIAGAPPPGDRQGPDPDPPPSPSPVLVADRAEDDAEPTVVPTASAEDIAPPENPGPAGVPAAPTKKVRSGRLATPAKKPVAFTRSQPGPAITPRKTRGRAAPSKKVTSFPAVPEDARSTRR